ncbi:MULTISPECIES: hypothetical protein [Streptomyces]|uniref:Secreted protein n=1 Tax=Streptomyces halstedii TaxID=1944 RepID=A0A6N9U2Q2_STRHA|nr:MULTISPECIES: hypothetical protein [Streptomyces]MYQ53678.1 hypothetical protein [Streptomyces sp. SID4941]MYR71811.1 hypothetical protein [Streptomyces sp. SID4925]MYY16056.1 hypothetical protein [Streptomyces sp. SID4912]AWL41433.1 hypothetical protein B9S64_27615 [Streptomyces sp. SM18]KDQ70398.1 hypothetical protein DT87_25335 [Streptomyces sp. NTK 937]
MKYAKTAAFVAGSVVALGTAAPAFAAPATSPTLSLTTGVNHLMASTPQVFDPVVDTVGGATRKVHEDGTVARLADQATGVAAEAAPLLGGLPVGG